MKSLFLIAVCLFLHFLSYSQKDCNQWVFGNQLGLDFNSNPPTVTTNTNLNSMECSAAIADWNGNLLFYTEGSTIWDKNHGVMANGTNLGGGWSAANGAVIVKQPGNANLYYLFNTGQTPAGNFSYSIVDMSLAGGLGAVTVSAATVFSPVLEGVCGVRHCNGTDVWIIVQEKNSSNLKAYLLTASGLSLTPVTSSVGVIASTVMSITKAAPGGKKLINSQTQGDFTLFDFDNTTGIISNSLSLSFPTQSPLNTTFSYGCDFSHDGSKVYGCVYGFTLSGQTAVPGLFQWDICAGSNAAIIASRTNINPGTDHRSILRATNGKMYSTSSASNTVLNVVGSPNLLGTSSNFTAGAFSVPTGTTTYGLPNFVNDIKEPLVSFAYTTTPSLGCQTASFTSPYAAGTGFGCSASGYTIGNVTWNFGDPLSGSSNTSSLQNPSHAFTNLGTYTVQQILHYTCGVRNDTLREVVQIVDPCITINASVSCSSLGSATAQTSTGPGSFTYTWLPTNQTGPVATGLVPGNYTLLVYYSITNTTYTVTKVLSSPVPFSGNINLISSIPCNGAATGTGNVTNITGGSADQIFSWTNGSVTYTTLNTPTIGILSAGVWTTEVIDTLTGCRFSQQNIITQPPATTLFLNGNPSACLGDSIVLQGINTGGTPFSLGSGYTYTWTSGPASDTYTVSESVAGTYVYTLSSSDSLNCLTAKSITVNFAPKPTLSVSDVSICPLEIGTLNASGANSYTWNGVTTGSSFIDSPATTTQYTVIGSAQSCTSSATANIILKPLPFVSIGISSPLCEFDNLSMAAYGGTAYAWSGPSGFTSSQQSPQVSNVSLSQNGVYTVTITATNACTSSTQGTLQVNPSPAVTITPVGTICSSKTLNLNASSMAGSSYLWTGPQNFSSTSPSTFITNPPIGLFVYNLKVTSPQNCTNTAALTVSVTSPPSLNVSLSSPSMCAQALNGSSNSITLTSSGANTYTLNTPVYISNTSPAGTISPIGTLPPYNSGISTATLFGSNGVCTESTTVKFNVIPNPTIGVNSNTPAICAGETFTYTSFGAQSYTWGSSSPGLTTYSMGQVAVGNPSINSMFSVMGGSLGCFSAIKTVSIDVHPIPKIILGPNTPSICLNKHIELFAGGDGTSFLWQPSTGLSSTSGATVIASPPSLQNYTVIASALGCTNSAVISLSVLSLPSPTIVNTKNRACANEEIILEAFGGSVYDWNGPAVMHQSGNPLRFTSNSFNGSGIYTVVATDILGCQSSTTTEVFIDPLPEGYLKGTLEACAPFTSNFYFQKFFNGSDHIKATWELNGRPVSSKSTFTYSFTSAGDYIFTGHFIDTLSSCVNSNTFVVKALSQPTANFAFEPAKPIEGMEPVLFTNTSEGTKLNKFNWYFIDNDSFSTVQKNTSYHFTNAGKYPVVMVVADGNGCKDSIIKTVEVAIDFAFYVPNAFTPNEDDKNEIFIPVIRGVKFYEIMIFNRWGESIFRSTDLNKGWDGTFKGESCQQGSYVWKVTLTTTGGEEKFYSGSVLLYR